MSDHQQHLCDACLKEEYENFRRTCVHESMAKNEIWLEQYKINGWPRWDYSVEEAILTFSEEGKTKVICDIQVVGSTRDDSWEWSWGNINLPLACRRLIQEVKMFGEEKQWDRLTTLFLDSDEFLGWECASIANHLLSGTGAYRFSTGGKGDFIYVVILSSRFVN